MNTIKFIPLDLEVADDTPLVLLIIQYHHQ